MGKFKVRKDRILVIDLELTCWDGGPPECQKPEIIEIGIAEIDVSSTSLLRSHSFLIRPEFSTVSDYCTSLTGHTQARLKSEGRTLAETARLLKKNFGSASKAWIAWGEDREAVINDCSRKGVDYPLSEAFHNFGQAFSFMMGSSSSIGLTSAMKLIGLERVGKMHTGEGDAIDTARLWLAHANMVQNFLANKNDANIAAQDVPNLSPR